MFNLPKYLETQTHGSPNLTTEALTTHELLLLQSFFKSSALSDLQFVL